MATILQTISSDAFLLTQNFAHVFWLKFHRVFFPKGLIDNKPVLFQVMAWYWTGDKPLYESMLTQFTDVYMWH